MLSKLLTLLCLCLGLVMADIKLDKMKKKYSVSDTIEISWKDDGDDPKLSDLTTATFLLCTGSNSDLECFEDNPIKKNADLSSLKGKYKADMSQLKTVGSNGPYFIQMTALSKKSGNDIHYSTRFDLSGMTGSKKASDGGDTDPPDPQVSLGEMDDAEKSKMGKLPYTKQTKKTRVAPMQMQPSTKVTRKLKASRRHATSAVTYYSTPRKSLEQMTTITPGWSYTYSAWTNYAKTLPSPTKFYAATAAQKSHILASSKKPTKAPKTKRWA